MDDNVIVFPRAHRNPDMVKTMEDVDADLEMVKFYHIQETINLVTPMVFNQLAVAGFASAMADDEFGVKDGAFMIEAVRSILCKYYGIYHPFQDIVEQVLTPDAEEGEGYYKLAKSLNVTFKNEEGVEQTV